MSDAHRDALSREIDSLAERMGARLAEFGKAGAFAQQRGQLARISDRHRQLRKRFDAAQGPDWEQAKDDLAREHGDLTDEFVKFEQKLDRRERERPHHDREPGAKSGLV